MFLGIKMKPTGEEWRAGTRGFEWKQGAPEPSRPAMHGGAKHIRSDIGPEVTANELRAWLGRVGASTLSIEPGSPWENGYAGERLRRELPLSLP
jgi:hypothetical protein